MIDATGLIQDLRALLDSSSVVEGLDKAVEHRSNTSRREAAVEAIDKIVRRVDDAYRRQALIPLHTGAYLVHSRTNASGASKISVEPDTNIRMGLDTPGDSWVNKIDGGGNRYTYYGEFGERVTRLREEMLRGNLDPVLGLDPALILHGVSGLRGELLPAIGWDPLKGETYTMFANDPYLNTMREFDAWSEQLARTREESLKTFKDLVKTFFSTPKKPYANAIVTHDYKVYPVTLPREDAGKLRNTPQAKRATTAKRLTIAIGFNTDPELGITYTSLMDEHRIAMGIQEEINGILVTSVNHGSPAQRAGIKGYDRRVTVGELELEIGGDIILEADGKKTETTQELQQWAESRPTESNLKIFRNGSIIEITLPK